MRTSSKSLCRLAPLGCGVTDYDRMHRASTSMQFVMVGAVKCLDGMFYEGFSRDNPATLAAYLQVYRELLLLGVAPAPEPFIDPYDSGGNCR